MVKELGSWTLTSATAGGQFDPKTWNLLNHLITDNQYGTGTLFSMSVSADDKNSTNNIICVSSPVCVRKMQMIKIAPILLFMYIVLFM